MYLTPKYFILDSLQPFPKWHAFEKNIAKIQNATLRVPGDITMHRCVNLEHQKWGEEMNNNPSNKKYKWSKGI